MYKRQSYVEKIVPFIDKPLIKVITGMRRSGKSTIMQLLVTHLINSGVDQQRIIFINMESLDNSYLTNISELHKFVREKKTKAGGRLYLFIDEIQEIPEWEKAVNSFLADNDADIFITGSNSRLLSGELATLLTGRFVEFAVYPLVFSEFCVFRNSIGTENSLFNEFIKFGGMPGIHHLEFDESNIYQYLCAIRDSVMLKDVIMRNNIRDIALIEKIMLFICDNIGNVFSGRRIADYFKNERRSISVETIYNYLRYLETAFIINRVSRYDIKGKRLLETNDKYYLTDLGLRHALFGYREKDINAYLENIVYIELRHRGYNVTIGKYDDYEVDFVAEKQNDRIYIQVSYLLADDSVYEREVRPFYKINDNFPKYLLTLDTIPESSNDGVLRRYLPDWLKNG